MYTVLSVFWVLRLEARWVRWCKLKVWLNICFCFYFFICLFDRRTWSTVGWACFVFLSWRGFASPWMFSGPTFFNSARRSYEIFAAFIITSQTLLSKLRQNRYIRVSTLQKCPWISNRSVISTLREIYKNTKVCGAFVKCPSFEIFHTKMSQGNFA